MNTTALPDIFDRKRLAAFRNRAAATRSVDDFLWQHMADELSERLAYVSRTFQDVLIIGPISKYSEQILAGRSVNITHAPLSAGALQNARDRIVQEDRLPFAAESFDLILSAGTLDSVNDLPGALIQIRRALRPDGLLLASLFGAGSLGTLKSAMMQADGDKPQTHMHPQIDLRSAADLMTRAGYALPVADIDRLEVRYSDWRALVRDLRNMGLGNALAGPRHYLGQQYIENLSKAWNAKSNSDGKVTESFSFLQLSGWAPSPDQPQPAKRGSGAVSLAAILKPKTD
jgi:NADH dehydrogenase [ubiquinone] 1 alpha subcomplex assembly factor 5